MLRRVAQVLGIGLVGLAVTLLVWIPFSFSLGVLDQGAGSVWPLIQLAKSSDPYFNLRVLLWLLALLCLAWPVSSFIIHRRRGKRGFPVSVAPLPMGEVPSESESEAERASWRGAERV